MMEDYTSELEERLNKKDNGFVELVAGSNALNVEPYNDQPSPGELARFNNRKMAVMMMRCVNSETAQSHGSDWDIVGVVREATMSVVGEVVFAVEAGSSVVIAAVEQNISTSAGTPVAQLLAIAGQVITKVCKT